MDQGKELWAEKSKHQKEIMQQVLIDPNAFLTIKILTQLFWAVPQALLAIAYSMKKKNMACDTGKTMWLHEQWTAQYNN